MDTLTTHTENVTYSVIMVDCILVVVPYISWVKCLPMAFAMLVIHIQLHASVAGQ